MVPASFSGIVVLLFAKKNSTGCAGQGRSQSKLATLKKIFACLLACVAYLHSRFPARFLFRFPSTVDYHGGHSRFLQIPQVCFE
jgi:hypothetical protein